MGKSKTYGYDTAGNHTSMSVKASSDCDFNGNLTDRFHGTVTDSTDEGTLSLIAVGSDQSSDYERFTYNSLNQLTKYEAGSDTAEYSYRPDGMQYSKSTGN